MEVRRTANTATFVTFPLIDADGDTVSSAAGLDSEWVAYADGAGPAAAGNPGFADMASEATELGTTGVYYLAVAAAELPVASPYVYIQIKTSTSGAKTQHILINTATWYADVTRWNGTALPAAITAGYVQLDMAQTLPASPTQSTTGHALVTARQATEYLDADVSSRLAPTVAARTLDVSAGGEAGVDWANVGTPGSAVNLSATTVNLTNTATAVTNDVNLALGQTLSGTPTAQTVGQALKFAREATEYLDVEVSTRLALATTLSGSPTAQTVGEALKFAREATEYVDGTISTRLELATTLSGSPTAQTVGEALKFAREATEYLDVEITSRLAPTVAARTIDVDASGGVEVGSHQAGSFTSAAWAAGAIDASAVAANAIGDSELAADGASKYADALLTRSLVSGSSGAGGGGDRDVRSALFGLRNRVSIVAGTMTVYGANDTTSWWTAAVASQAVSEILVEVDPA